MPPVGWKSTSRAVATANVNRLRARRGDPHLSDRRELLHDLQLLRMELHPRGWSLSPGALAACFCISSVASESLRRGWTYAAKAAAKAGSESGRGSQSGECGQEIGRGQAVHAVLDEPAIEVENDLVGVRNLQPVAEVAKRGIDRTPGCLDLNGEPGLVREGDQKIHFPAGAVPQVTQLDPVTVAVFEKMAELQEVEPQGTKQRNFMCHRANKVCLTAELTECIRTARRQAPQKQRSVIEGGTIGKPDPTGAAGRSRTPDLELRMLLLYPTELQPQ